VSNRPFVISVTIACTAAFAVPLGYQTHLMVLGPGGYTNFDFFKVGLPMDLLYMGTIAGLAPLVWPF
jgi:di/tricarboxylate transporter